MDVLVKEEGDGRQIIGGPIVKPDGFRSRQKTRHRIQTCVDVVLGVHLPVAGARTTVRTPGALFHGSPEEGRRNHRTRNGATGCDPILGQSLSRKRPHGHQKEENHLNRNVDGAT
jgi:hypothetical protein